MHVVGVEVKAPFTAVYMSDTIKPRLWEEISKRSHEIKHQRKQASFIGVALSKNRIYHYIAGIEVTKPVQIPERMVGITLPAREYASYTHEGGGTRENTDQTYFYVLDKLRSQGLDHDPDAYSMEVHADLRTNKFTVCIPLRDE
ncbi:GyrI-like domain-containing protein [Ornithinibacillus salinisoli]|uniref:GyrI-like domain-containing protein n=1 Tax=Ornithinibacillus salinisoli TaxID=1848459 RepID=A0ABW4VYH8_9BACI